jgi:phosphate/sulfate permease
LGVPNSTTHTYIGSIIGVAMAHAFVRGQPVVDQINWHQGQKILIIFLSALALGLDTAVGYEKIVVTLGEKMGSAHMNPAHGTAAQASAIIGIGLANFGGMPVSTTHVLSAAVLGSVAGTKGEKVNMHTAARSP